MSSALMMRWIGRFYQVRWVSTPSVTALSLPLVVEAETGGVLVAIRRHGRRCRICLQRVLEIKFHP